ncbi:MAG: hypothetical protein WBH20_14830 [Oceanisphaera sp.]|uniref:hypothetical protein n=1 Tax=Oceanisphaera sp. TaxID=1929979 RepID=UPI003C74E96E
MNNRELILAYAADGRRFTSHDVRRDTKINPSSITYELSAMAASGDVTSASAAGMEDIGPAKVFYRVANSDIHKDLLKLVLFGSAGGKS